jgi:hypothetical protein
MSFPLPSIRADELPDFNELWEGLLEINAIEPEILVNVFGRLATAREESVGQSAGYDLGSLSVGRTDSPRVEPFHQSSLATMA